MNAARKVLGAGIGMCPKPKLFSGYIELEMRLREFDRVRILYEKFLSVSPQLIQANRMLNFKVRLVIEFRLDPVDPGRECCGGLFSCPGYL